MANTSVIRPAGQTYYLAVTATSSASLLINDTTNDQVNYCGFLNNGSKACAVNFSPGNINALPAVYPVSGTPGNYVLPPLMEVPIILAVPTTPFYMTAICGTGNTTDLYITAAADQS